MDLVIFTYVVELGGQYALRRKKALARTSLTDCEVRAILAYGLREDFG